MIRFSNRQILAALCVTAAAPLALGQTTTAVSPGAGDTVTVTDSPSTWIRALLDNGVNVPAGADGVVVSNGRGGVIEAPLNAIVSAADATQVINAGRISGGLNAINFVSATNGVVTNLAGGVIESGSRAIDLGTGSVVTNAGQIIGTGNQRNGTIYADASVDSYTVTNLGTIDAGAGNQGAGIALEVADRTTATITNAGTIQGRIDGAVPSAASGASADGVRLANFTGAANRVFDGTVTNQAGGVIRTESNNGTVAGFRAANTVGFQGTLNNAGLIEGVRNGVYFGNAVSGLGADHTGGVVNNSGVIASDSRAFNLDGTGLTVNNTGEIIGTGRQRNGALYIDGTASDFTINNLEDGVIGTGDRGGLGSGVSIQVGLANGAAGTQAGSITNAGTIAGVGDQAVDAGIRLFAPEAGDVFQGDIVNQLGGVISADTAPAVLVQDGVVFDGTLLNDGTILGGASLASGDAVLGASSLVSLDLGGVLDGEFETFDVGGSLTLGGVLEITFHDGFAVQVGDTFDLLDFASVSGGFAAIDSGLVQFDTGDLLIGGSVTVTAVPEPASLALLTLGGIALAGRRRRGA